MATTTIKRGSTTPALTASLVDANGAAINLTTATSVTMVMRSQSGVAPSTSATATITNAATGAVSYTWTAQDTSTAGRYDVEWVVNWTGGAIQRFPIQGYQSVSIEEDLTTPGGARLVSLEEIRDHLRMASGDRQFDARLLRLLDAMTPVIENVTGPIVQRVYTETYDGGNNFITVRHRPIVEVHSVTEYRGPIPYVLTQVPSPDLGTIYSYEFQPNGRITRRTVGGGVTAFPPGFDSVVITYTAGQAVIPNNVKEATLRMIDLHFQRQELGGGRAFGGGNNGLDDELPKGPPIGFFMPGVVRELLQPNRRHPSVA